jgi:hypothetical protein
MDNAKLTNQLLHILRGLLLDTEEMLDLGKGTLDCDYEKIAKSVKSRGLRVLLVELPSLCSAFERALDGGDRALMTGAPFVRKDKCTILKALFSKIFTEVGCVRYEFGAEPVRCLRQILKFAKKFRIDAPVDAVKEKYLEFASIEKQLHHPRLSWGSDDLNIISGYPTFVDLGHRHFDDGDGLAKNYSLEDRQRILGILDSIQRVSDRLAGRFKFKPEWFVPKHGPGAVSEQFKNSKYEFPTWPFRLESIFPIDKYGLVSHQIWDGTPEARHSVPCKLIGVPKDFKGPRLIASEPISSQFVQQGIMNVLRENVKHSLLRHCIDFRSQEPSREMALDASDNGLSSTIDLSSASDRLSCAVVECAFRRNYSFMEVLNAARTPDVQFPDGSVVRMKKFAAQGAAFTFPIQTIVYSMVCIGVILWQYPGTKMSDAAKYVRVYGDDMIVPTYVFDEICEILEVLQLKVNISKSFSKGYFRESCGMDAFIGQNVTPANVLTTFQPRQPDSLVSTVECANNLYLKGFWNASRHLLETIPQRYLKDIARKDSESTVFGIVSGHRGQTRTRWNEQFCRLETRILVVENKVSKTKPDGHEHLFQWFLENPARDVVWAAGEVFRVKARYSLRWVPSHQVRLGWH